MCRLCLHQNLKPILSLEFVTVIPVDELSEKLFSTLKLQNVLEVLFITPVSYFYYYY